MEVKEEPVGVGRENLRTLMQGPTLVGERRKKGGLDRKSLRMWHIF